MKKRYLIITMLLIFFIVLGISIYRRVKLISGISEMFKINAELQSEGYYMGEFEFKMLGCVYYVDKGQYYTAFTRLNEINNQLKSKSGLIKIPKFQNKEEELEFYLNLQNPRTGAFMDDSYPLFTYIGPTLNMVEHIEKLAKETGQPLQLKYSLKFLDQINTSEKLTSFLEDLSTIGVIGSKLPKTPYIEIAELCYYQDLERNNLYTFSSEWKQALLKWFYENQDSKTGFWGSKLRSNGELWNQGDLGPTFHIIKLFVDENGKNINPEFPLKYKDELFSTILQKISEPMPADADLSEIHDWSLTRYQGIKLLTNYLWKDASVENKSNAKKFMEELIINRFQNFYVQDQGGFSLYPKSQDATLDGTGTALSLFDSTGMLSRDKQELLWGDSNNQLVDLGIKQTSTLRESDFTSIINGEAINSIRLYKGELNSNNYEDNVAGIIYPKETTVLDVVDLLPRVTKWINTTSQNIGNWESKENIKQQLLNINIQEVPIFNTDISIDAVNQLLQKNGKLTIVGFDILQIPKYKITFCTR